MQMNGKMHILSAKRGTVDGNRYASVIAVSGEFRPDETDRKGLDVIKISCEPEFLDQLPKLPADVEFITTLKGAAGGKSQPHIIGIKPGK